MRISMAVGVALAGCLVVSAATQVQDSSALDDALVRAAERLITTALDKERIPGASLAIVHDGRVLAVRGFGTADLASGRPVTADTVFRIGSISKAVTALGVMQLAGAGRLALTDDVNRHLTQFKIQSGFKTQVQVSHLLTHTAGFDQRFMNREGARESDRYSLASFLETNLFVIRPPGMFASYDTYGITLAGHLIEQVSGMPYDVYMRERIFTPIGMSHSSVGVAGVTDIATGYRLAGETPTPQAWEHYRTAPASSINSSATDMSKLMLTILAEGKAPGGARLWPEAIGRQLQEPQYQNGPGGGFAYGFWDENRDGIRGVFHGGNMNGYESHMYLAPEHEFGFYIAYNREGRPYPTLRDELTSTLRRLLLRDAGKTAAAAAPAPALSVPVEEFAGAYADATYCHTCYENESEGGMSAFPVETAGAGRLRFSNVTWVAVGPLAFAEEGGTRRAHFTRDDEGRISHFAISHRTYEKLTDRLVERVAAASGIPVDRHPFAPRVYRLMQQHGRAADAYAKLTAIRPWDGVLHHYHGLVLLNAGRGREAIAPLERAAAARQWPTATYYLLATAHAGAGNAAAALTALERAAEAGFRDAARLERDQAFQALRGDARFTALVQRMKQ